MSRHFLVALGCLLAQVMSESLPARAEPPCACKFFNARSDSTTGACEVHEVEGRNCEMLWGPLPGVQNQSTFNFRPRADAVIREIQAAALFAARPAAAPQALVSLEQLQGDDYWSEVSYVVTERARIGNADLFTRSLAFLAQPPADGYELPRITVGAALFALSAGLSRTIPSAELRSAIITALLSQHHRLAAFAVRGSGIDGPFQEQVIARQLRPGQIPPGIEVQILATIDGFVQHGCIEIVVSSTPRAAHMVKTGWNPTQADRCTP